MVIEGEGFDKMNLTDGETFLTPLTKRTKARVNRKIKVSRDTKRRIRENAIKMIGTHRFSRYCVIHVMENLFSKKTFSVDYQNLLNKKNVDQDKPQASRAKVLLQIV